MEDSDRGHAFEGGDMGGGFKRFEDPFDARRDLLEGVIVDVVDELAGQTSINAVAATLLPFLVDRI